MNPWTPESVLAITRSFMESRVVLTGAELGVFTLLSDSPKRLDEVTAALKTTSRGTAILLDALAAMGLLTKEDDHYMCPEEVARILSADSPTTVLPMLNHAVGLWSRWSKLTDIVRQGAAARPTGVFEQEAGLEAFIGAMHVVGRHTADVVAEQAQADASRNLLDVGGATGTYAEAFLRRYPEMRATVFDRPLVIQLAKKRLCEAGLDARKRAAEALRAPACAHVMERITLVAGDFYTDELPGGHDLALLSAIIHQNSPDQNQELYRKVFRALAPGGRILIRDHVMSGNRTQPRAGALFAVNMLVATTGGNCYTLEEIRETLGVAGFSGIRLVQSGDMYGALRSASSEDTMNALVEAIKP